MSRPISLARSCYKNSMNEEAYNNLNPISKLLSYIPKISQTAPSYFVNSIN